MSRKIDATRARILDGAVRLLESGGSAVRMSDIAREAGVSRQALYLHFGGRAELLIAATRHVDALNGIEARLLASREAASGTERLDAWIEAWGNYIPEIHGIARALRAMADDEAAAAAWEDRLRAVRHGCEAAVRALAEDGALAPAHSRRQATDILWTLLSVDNWEQLTGRCGWSQRRYVETLGHVARAALVRADR